MQSSFDSDDFMKRGFFGSFMGFRKRASSKTDNNCLPPKQLPPPDCKEETTTTTTTSSVAQQHQVVQQQQQHRSEYDIYREIVTEAQFIERSDNNTPLSEFSCPPTPNYYPYPSSFQLPPPPMIQSPYHMIMTPIAPHPIPVDSNGVPLGTQCPMAPPPYTTFQEPQHCPMGQAPQAAAVANIPFEVKREIQEHLVHNGKHPVSIEEIVKLVVATLKDSQIDEDREESPEEILRRKRVQNNLAAARYRKRQRDARETAEVELSELAKRNEDLKEMVAKMEREIDCLKHAVLHK